MRLVQEKKPDIVLSEVDYRLLSDYLVKNEGGVTGSALEEEIGRAEVVPFRHLSMKRVALNTKVTFQDVKVGATRTITIVEPGYSDATKGFVSVLAPVGAALLGLAVGQEIDWPMPNGQRRRFKVKSISAPSSGPELEFPRAA